MVAYSTVLAVVGSLVVSGKAASSASHANFIRQVAGGFDPSQIPDACTGTCTALTGISDGSCADLDCLCSATVSSSMSGCLQCTINVGAEQSPDADVSLILPQIQQVYDGYATSCNSAGQTVPAHTFTAGAGSGTPETSTETSGTTTTGPTTGAAATTGTTTTTGSIGTTRTQTTASSTGTTTGTNGNARSNDNGASRIHVGVAGLVGILGSFALLL